MPGNYPPSLSSSAQLYPGYVLAGFNGSPGAGLVVGIQSTAYFTPYKACTLVMMEFSVYSTNSVAATLSVQPYGNPAAGNGNLYGTALSVSVPASGVAASYRQAQNLAISFGGYMGIGVTPTSGSSVAIAMDAVLYFTQAAQ